MDDKKSRFPDTVTITTGLRSAPGLLWQPLATSAFRAEVIGGPMDGKKVRVESDWFTVGRGEKNDLSLPHDPMVSTNHARVVREGRRYWLEDLGSRNGTFVGGVRLEGRVGIEPGTLFIVGNTCIEFMPQ
jgi:pSer/pThr/pTyr-binding forkhead associated (FHA) protein